MCLSWLKPAYWADMGHPEAWATIAGGLLTALGTLLSVGVAAYLTYRYTRRHSMAAHNTEIRVDRLRRDIDALEKLWELLAYMSFRESDHSIVRWRDDRQGNRTHFFHLGNLKQFLLWKTEDVFYQHHAGLHIPNKIRGQLFEYCSLLMGLYLRYENDESISEDALIKLENKNLIERLRRAYDSLNEDLKSELEIRYEQLAINDGKGY